MQRVVITIDTAYDIWPTETMADLRNVAENQYHPLREVGFWDVNAEQLHLCRLQSMGKDCPHILDQSDPAWVSYVDTVEEEMRGSRYKAVLPDFFFSMPWERNLIVSYIGNIP